MLFIDLIVTMLVLLFAVLAIEAGMRPMVKSSLKMMRFNERAMPQDPEEIERIKAYAELYGLDNAGIDIDVDKLLELGDKIGLLLGEEKVEHMLKDIRRNRLSLRNARARAKISIGHVLNTLVSATKLIVKQFLIKTMKLGGVNNGKEEAAIN